MESGLRTTHLKEEKTEMSKQKKKPDKYDEKVKINIPKGLGFDDVLLHIARVEPSEVKRLEAESKPVDTQGTNK